MSEKNYFYCPICCRYTTLVRISSSEFMSRSSGGNPVMSLLGGINDITGGGRLVNAVMGSKQWKCSLCGSCSQRRADGSMMGDLF